MILRQELLRALQLVAMEDTVYQITLNPSLRLRMSGE
jgi:hypothetical protein